MKNFNLECLPDIEYSSSIVTSSYWKPSMLSTSNDPSSKKKYYMRDITFYGTVQIFEGIYIFKKKEERDFSFLNTVTKRKKKF